MVDRADTALHRDLKAFLSHSCVTETPSQVMSSKCAADVGLPSSNEKAIFFPLHLYSARDPPSSKLGLENLSENLEGARLLQCKPDVTTNAGTEGEPTLSTVRKAEARSRWKRVTHTVTLINHMAANIRSASTDLLEGSAVDEMLQQQGFQVDAGGVGAATFEGAKTVAQSRCKGRKGMEGLLVRQGTGFLTFFQGFYVAFLKVFQYCLATFQVNPNQIPDVFLQTN